MYRPPLAPETRAKARRLAAFYDLTPTAAVEVAIDKLYHALPDAYRDAAEKPTKAPAKRGKRAA